MPSSPPRLSAGDIWHLLSPSLRKPPAPTSLAILVRPNRPSDVTYASLLATAATRHDIPLTVLAPPYLTNQLRSHIPSVIVQDLPSLPHGALRAAARHAIAADIPHLILPDTRVDRAVNSLCTMHATPSDTGVEMLPPGVLTISRPFTTIPETTLDASTPALAPATTPAQPTETELAQRLIGPAVALDSILSHGATKAALIADVHTASTALIRACLLEASHWGYVVVRRSTLAAEYHSSAGGRLIAMHALSRLMLHVSGSNAPPTLDDEQISHLARDLLALDARGSALLPLPKGRTVGGMVVRPATGRFARRLLQQDRRVRMSNTTKSRILDTPDDLMILTREPDHESSGLLSRRLRSNWCSMALRDTPVYWDNRFVLSVAPISTLDTTKSPIDPKATLLAALTPPDADNNAALTQATLYARQIRRMDWERVTAATNRVRSFQVPFQCIRALPAIFEKTAGETSPGQLAASPHLGLSARPDLYFTAVRMPRFRSLPPEMDPGFCVDGFRKERERATRGPSEEKRRPVRRRWTSSM